MGRWYVCMWLWVCRICVWCVGIRGYVICGCICSYVIGVYVIVSMCYVCVMCGHTWVRDSHACTGKGLQHLLGATKRAFSLFYIFWNSDYRQWFPLNILKLGLPSEIPTQMDWNLKIQKTTIWCIEVSCKPAALHPWMGAHVAICYVGYPHIIYSEHAHAGMLYVGMWYVGMWWCVRLTLGYLNLCHIP